MNKNNRKHQQHKNTVKKPLLISEKKNRSMFFVIIAICVPVLLYLQTIKYGFTHFDDDLLISNNITFLSDLKNVPHAFLTDAFIVKLNSYYRPLQTLSFMVDIKLSGGNNTWMYHLSNILLLGLIACLLFLLLKKFLIPPKLALLSTLIYCAHPLFVSSVAYIPTRGELLLTLFSLLSFLFLIELLRKGKIIYLLLNWAAFTVALFCKETAALLPLLFIIYYYTFSSEKRNGKKLLLNILLYAISGIFWFWIRTKALSGISNWNDSFGLTSILTNFRTIPESLSKFFFHFDMAPFPGFSIFKTFAGSVIIVLIIIIFLKNKERPKKEKIFCLAWFFILMLPPLLGRNDFIDYLDHRFFLPMIGILLFLLFIIPKKWLTKGDIARPWIFIAVIVFLSSFSFVKSRAYSDPMTYFSAAVASNPNSAFAYFCLGIEKKAKNDLKGALEDYNKAISLRPEYADVYNNRGNLKRLNSDLQGAISDYNKAVVLNPKNADAYNNIGVVMGTKGNLNEALINFNKAIEINPNFTDAYTNRALAKYSLKDLTGAIADLDKALKLNPKNEANLKFKIDIQKELQKN